MRLSKAITSAAAAWLVRLGDAKAGPDVHEAFLTWLDADPRHEAAALRILANMQLAAEASGDEQPTRTNPSSPSRRVLLAGAGALAGAALVAWAGLLVSAPQTYAAALGEQREVHLADGSVLVLNTLTQAEVRFTRSMRHIHLDHGEAYLDIAAHDPRPLVFEAANYRLSSHRARFAIRTTPIGFSLLVAEGDVAVFQQGAAPTGPRLRNRPLLVACGHELSVGADGVALRSLTSAEIEDRLSWRSGWLEFLHVPLVRVAGEVSRYTGVSFSFDDQAIANTEFVGRLKANDLDGFIANLERTDPSLTVGRQGNEIRIGRRVGVRRT